MPQPQLPLYCHDMAKCLKQMITSVQSSNTSTPQIKIRAVTRHNMPFSPSNIYWLKERTPLRYLLFLTAQQCNSAINRGFLKK